MASKVKQAAADAEAARVKVIADMVAALSDQGVGLDPNGEDELRWIAEDLQVPFLVVWLADAKQRGSMYDPDLDDMIAGLEWLREHHVPLALLRREAPFDAAWRAQLASTDEVTAKSVAEERIRKLTINYMDRASRAAKATGFDVDHWMKARANLGVFHD